MERERRDGMRGNSMERESERGGIRGRRKRRWGGGGGGCLSSSKAG